MKINSLISSHVGDTINSSWFVVEDIAYRLDADTPNYEDATLFPYLRQKIPNGATYKGSQIVAVSVEYDIGRFILNAQMNTFNDRAGVYLVQRDGIIVAQYGKT